ncbi:hypothetical protein G9A89_004415 [Geosiphon pyriformis]|nr:hypothetical protein G9A89_004415 [Geosiphon pyriformis]
MGNSASIERRRKKRKDKPREPFRAVNGRLFNNVPDSLYPLPSDELECDRLAIQHFLFRHLWQGNFSSPIEPKLREGARVLDVGCGPGTWLLDMASQYDKTEFYGIDIVPIFPSEIKPFNTHFERADILRGLPFPNGHFDFVRASLLNLAFTERDWQEQVIPELIRVTKIGGWIEIEETDMKITNSPPELELLMEEWFKSLRRLGIDLHITSGKLQNFLNSTGSLISIAHKTKMLSYSDRGGRAGEISKENIIMFYQALAPMITSLLGISHEEYDEILKGCTKYAFDPLQSFHNLHRFYGMKLYD